MSSSPIRLSEFLFVFHRLCAFRDIVSYPSKVVESSIFFSLNVYLYHQHVVWHQKKTDPGLPCGVAPVICLELPFVMDEQTDGGRKYCI